MSLIPVNKAAVHLYVENSDRRPHGMLSKFSTVLVVKPSTMFVQCHLTPDLTLVAFQLLKGEL